MRSIYFHEDDFNQIEILPEENEMFCSSQVKKIEAFADAHKNGVGYTEMFVRGENPATLYKKSISVKTLENSVIQFLPKYDEVHTGYGEHKILCRAINAYGLDENVVLFCQLTNDVVEYLWLTLDIKKENDIQIALNMFKAIESISSLMLTDWLWSFTKKIGQTDDIKEYLKKRFEVFRQDKG